MHLKQDVFKRHTQLIVIAWITFTAGMLYADVTRDGTIGPDDAIQATGPDFLISEQLGELKGTNLFHSFKEFSLSQNQSATFTGTSAIHNIIGRVTGDNVSTIDGMLRSTIPGANLFLMNPHGVIFGEHAQLDVRGAFHAGTGDELVFAGGEVFSAMPKGNVPILSTAVPERFGFLGPSAAPIELNGSTLVNAHDVTLSGGTVTLNDDATIETATDNVRTGGGITLTAIDRVSLSDSRLDAETRAEDAAGAIRVQAPRIEVLDGASMSATSEDAGNSGGIRLVAGEHLILAGWNSDGQSSNLQAQAKDIGHAGLIDLEAPVIELRDGAYATTATADAGNGGELLVTATERVTLSGNKKTGEGSAFLAGTKAQGRGGTILVDAPLIELRDGAYISSRSDGGSGEAGNVQVTAAQQLTFSGTNGDGVGASLQASTDGDGAAGNIRVTAPLIELRDGAWMESNTSGSGSGGDLEITATQRLKLSGTNDEGLGSSLQATANNAGQGGTLTVKASRVDLRDGAFLKTSTEGSDRGGTLIVRASERLTLSGTDDRGTGARLEANSSELGVSGGIEIHAREILLEDGASIASASTSGGTEDAGSIKIVAGDRLQLTGQSTISTEASENSNASGGDIDIQADGLIHLNNSNISTNVGSGDHEGGDITINSDVLVLNSSRITAQAADIGSGGNIQIFAKQLLATPDSIIDASAGPAGIDGSVGIAAPESDLNNELPRPAAVFLDANIQLQPDCEARAQGSPGSFTVAHQRGLPLSPENLLLAFDVPAPMPTKAKAQPHKVSVSALDAAASRSATLRGIAIKQQTEGHYSDSLDTLANVQAEQPHHLASTLGSAANAYLALGITDTALANFTQALKTVAEDDHVLRATLLNNLGNLHMVRQDFAAATRAYADAVEHAWRANNVTQEAKALANGARAALAEGQSQRAASMLAQAQTVAHTLRPSQNKAYILIHLAKTARQLSQKQPADQRRHFATAYNNLRTAAMFSNDEDDLRTLSYALGNLGGLYQSQNRLEEALYLTRLAAHAAERANAPESLYRWHWQAGQLLWAQGLYRDALQAYRRAVALLEDSRPETLAQYGTSHAHFRQLVAPVYLEFIDALLQHSARAANPATLLLEARATVEQLKGAELRDYFRDECITELHAKNTRLEAISPTAAIIYPIILPQRLELLVSLPEGLRRYPVDVDATLLTQTIDHFRTQVETRGGEWQLRKTAQQLYQWLIRPYAADLQSAGIDTLVFVPDGPLRTAPLAALHDGRDYLIRRYGVVVTPGLSLTDPRPLNRKNPRLLLAGISDPVRDFSALPHVTAELDRIRHLFGGRLLLNERFTAPKIARAMDAPITIVHVASHAQFTGNADDSFLLTHDGQMSMAQLGKTLEVARFRDRPLELLVLSACQTAIGDDRAAMGLAGIGLKAGARSAVGSLWFISDEGTSELMGDFYAKLKDPTLTKAQALQQAQQAMLEERRFAHPYYWSPFLLMNNWL